MLYLAQKSLTVKLSVSGEFIETDGFLFSFNNWANVSGNVSEHEARFALISRKKELVKGTKPNRRNPKAILPESDLGSPAIAI